MQLLILLLLLLYPTRYRRAHGCRYNNIVNRVNDVIYQRRRTRCMYNTCIKCVWVCVASAARARTKRSRGIDDVIMKLLIRRLRADSKTERPESRAICFAPPPPATTRGTCAADCALQFFLVARVQR